MAAIIRFVKPEDAEVLLNYLAADSSGVALVFPGAQKEAKESGLEDGMELDSYDFGGDADVFVERVLQDDHLILDSEAYPRPD